MGCPSPCWEYGLLPSAKKKAWSMAKQNKARQETEAERQGERQWSQELPVAAWESRCEVTSCEPPGKLQSRNELIQVVGVS